MKVLVYPSDEFGCGHHRLIWPAAVLQAQGHDVTIVRQRDRQVRMIFSDTDELIRVDIPDGVDVVVLQRTTDQRVMQMVRWLRERLNVAVVIDVDDDLAAVHPSNPAAVFLDPNRAKHEVQRGLSERKIKPSQADAVYALLLKRYTHSFHHLAEACRHATLVTVSTPGLIQRYAAHGRGVVLPNYVPEHYLQVEHQDSDVICWPAALHSHPNDPPALGNALARVVADGAEFRTIGDSIGVAGAFGLRDYEPAGGSVNLAEWPAALSQAGIGIAPLADTLFNSRKSWLKPLELSAVGVPWIASPRAEYARLHRQHGAGLLADKPRDWYRALRSLLDDEGRRLELSQAGLAAARELRLVDHAWRWAEAWQRAFETQRGQVAAAPRASLASGAS